MVKRQMNPGSLANVEGFVFHQMISAPLDYEQSLCFLIVRRERSEKNRPRESWPRESPDNSFRAACFFRSALDGL